MKMQTVLENATTKNVFTDPFPHILVENAVPEELLGRLLDELPTAEALAAGKSLGSNRHFVKDWRSSVMSPLWKEFISLHLTQNFLRKVIELTGEHMVAVNPILAEQYGSLESLSTGLRGIDSFETKDVLMDGQIFVTTPVVSKPDSYRIGHVDSPNKLYNGLLYMRLPGDDSVGANLELCRYRGEEKKFHNRLRKLIDHKYIETVKTVPYKAGTFILIPNSFHSVHRVQSRQKTRYPRYYMNVLTELPFELFDMDPYWETSFESLRRKIGA